MTDTENPFESISNCVAFWSGDWSTDKRLAWIYGIVSGWEDDEDNYSQSALDEVAQRHSWNAEAVARLKRLRAEYVKASEYYSASAARRTTSTGGEP